MLTPVSFEMYTLAANTTYSLSLRFVNTLEMPPEEITDEIKEEAEEHYVLIYGDDVTGPASSGGTLVTTLHQGIEGRHDQLAFGLGRLMTPIAVSLKERTQVLVETHGLIWRLLVCSKQNAWYGKQKKGCV